MPFSRFWNLFIVLFTSFTPLSKTDWSTKLSIAWNHQFVGIKTPTELLETINNRQASHSHSLLAWHGNRSCFQLFVLASDYEWYLIDVNYEVAVFWVTSVLEVELIIGGSEKRGKRNQKQEDNHLKELDGYSRNLRKKDMRLSKRETKYNQLYLLSVSCSRMSGELMIVTDMETGEGFCLWPHPDKES